MTLLQRLLDNDTTAAVLLREVLRGGRQATVESASNTPLQAALDDILNGGSYREIETTSDVLLEAMGLTEADEHNFTAAQCAYVLHATAALLGELSKNGSIRVLRTFALSDSERVRGLAVGVTSNLGVHWSFSPSRSLGDLPNRSHYVTVEAQIPNTSVDWRSTLGVLMLSAGGDWYEREITAKENAPVTVTDVHHDKEPFKGEDWFDTEGFLARWVQRNPYEVLRGRRPAAATVEVIGAKNYWLTPACVMVEVDDHIDYVLNDLNLSALGFTGNGDYPTQEEVYADEAGVTIGDLYEEAYRQKYVRIACLFGCIYVSGKPTNGQNREIRDFAIENKLEVRRDCAESENASRLLDILLERESKHAFGASIFLNPANVAKTYGEVMDEFRASGGTVAHGRQAQVLIHPDWDYVLKTFSSDVPALQFLRYAHKHPCPAFPRLLDIPRRISPQFRHPRSMAVVYVVPVEKLEHITRKEWDDLNWYRFTFEPYKAEWMDAKRLGWKQEETAIWQARKAELDRLHPDWADFLEAIKAVHANVDGADDFTQHNVMKRRDGTFVLADPVWEGESPYQTHDRLMASETDSHGYAEEEELIDPGKPRPKPKPKPKPQPKPLTRSEQDVPF